MDAVDKENRDPSQPTGATATIVRQEPMQQQQGVLEECAEYMTITEADGVAFKDSTLKDELEQVSSPLVDKQSRKQYHLPALVNQTYGIVVSLIKKEHNVKKAIVRCINMTGIQSCLDTERLLAALVTLIKIVDTNAFLLNPDNSARVTEQNFITQVWASILKSLSDIHGVLRMKIGEPSPAQGIGCRKRSYSDARVVKISGFKVGLRLLFDSRQNEHKLLALKAAKADDICKLMRVAKQGQSRCYSAAHPETSHENTSLVLKFGVAAGITADRHPFDEKS
ncbi:hypothetical protein V8B55DRAFT_1324687 [Mucor lusitanicus]|uniref:Uncharacterized protein n=1 Tax=Mucor circinelloides f. lusitanicus TaxID=29924 RepID=A0A8H4EXD5_MUCCL|nr:hypothetical protein FB192DRAFT_1451968 [Mucor lusitanicus]